MGERAATLIQKVFNVDPATMVPLCPGTGEPCIAAQNTADQYPPDSLARTVKMAEYCAAMTIRGCAGVYRDDCPIRKAMDSSTTRRLAVGLSRSILSRIRTEDK